MIEKYIFEKQSVISINNLTLKIIYKSVKINNTT